MVLFDAALHRWEVVVRVGCFGLAVMLPVCCLMCVMFCLMFARGIVHAIRVVKLRASVASCHLQNTMSRSVIDVEEHRHLAAKDSGSHLELKSIRPRSPQQCCFS
jgi:hypothetical protein